MFSTLRHFTSFCTKLHDAFQHLSFHIFPFSALSFTFFVYSHLSVYVIFGHSKQPFSTRPSLNRLYTALAQRRDKQLDVDEFSGGIYLRSQTKAELKEMLEYLPSGHKLLFAIDSIICISSTRLKD